MYICTQHGGELECPKGFYTACCYEACEEEEVVSCGPACLRFDRGEGCAWRKEVAI